MSNCLGLELMKLPLGKFYWQVVHFVLNACLRSNKGANEAVKGGGTIDTYRTLRPLLLQSSRQEACASIGSTKEIIGQETREPFYS